MKTKIKWSKKVVSWEDSKCKYFSIVFSWDLWNWCQNIKPHLFDNKKYIVGGPAVLAHPEWVPEWIEIRKNMDKPILPKHCSLATRTTLGCIRKCPFCIVPEMEGKFRELDDWENKPVLIDNNLLACSRKHFDKVIDRLKKLDWSDFNQGLDVRLLTEYHAERFAELKNPYIRLSLDDTKTESQFLRGFSLLLDAHIPVSKISVYVLIGYNDSPEDALYRLNLVKSLGALTNPMRYQPLDAKHKNSYVYPGWTNSLLIKYMRFWSSTRFLKNLPFDKFEYYGKRKKIF